MGKDSKKQRRYLRQHYSSQSDEELAAHLGLSKDELKRIAQKLGLKRQRPQALPNAVWVSPKVRFVFLTLVVLMGVLLYANTLRNEFVWDDFFLIKDNLYIRSIKFLPQIFTTDLHRFGLDRSNFYRPLQNISYMLDYAVGKFNVRPYHFSSLFLHLTAAILVYFIARRLSHNEVIAFLSAFIFVAHPVQTETVTYLSDRADLLAAVFVLGGFLVFLYYYARPGLSLLLAVNLCFILALLAKEISLTFPFLVFSWAKFYGDKESRGGVNLRPAYLSITSIAAVYILLRLSLLHFRGNTFGFSPNEVFSVRFLTMLKAIWRYFALLAFPAHLHMERNFTWVRSLAEPAAWAGAAIIAASVVLAKKARRQKSELSFAVVFFYISLFPVLNIIPVNAIMAEHWLYLPSFSFALIMASFIVYLYQSRLAWLKAVLALLLSANFSFYAYRAITRNAEWRNEETLYYATLREQPNSSRVYYNLGNIYAYREQYAQAAEKYAQAVEMQPDYAVAWCNLGLAYFKLGKVDLAIEQYHQALKYQPDLASAHNNLGLALDEKGKEDAAQAEYRKAIECDPDYAEPYNGLGVYYAKKGDWQQALFHFREALKRKPDFGDAINNLKRAEVLANLGTAQISGK